MLSFYHRSIPRFLRYQSRLLAWRWGQKISIQCIMSVCCRYGIVISVVVPMFIMMLTHNA